MKYRPRIYYTEEQKALMWIVGKKANPCTRLPDFLTGTIRRSREFFMRTGGIRPAKRSRSHRTLTLEEREEISRGVVAERSTRSIAASLGRAPSTIRTDGMDPLHYGITMCHD